MEIRTRHYHHIAIILLNGRFDAHAVPSFAQTVSEQIAADYTSLVIDLNQADFLDSGGVKALQEASQQVRQQGGDLRIANTHLNVHYLLKPAGLVTAIKIYPSIVCATASFYSDPSPETAAPIPHSPATD